MATLYGKSISRDQLTRRIGHISQVGGARACELTSGLARGTRAIDVRTGTGFDFTVLPDRGLDIAWASFRGQPIGYVSKSGVVAAERFVEDGFVGFLRNFHAGLMTTAGLSNIGVPSSDAGEDHGLHGRIGNTPAEDVSIRQDWQGDDYVVSVSGVVRQARIFGECLILRREITTTLGSNRLVVRDKVENGGFRPEPALLLYHCNFGWPIVGPATRLITSGGRVEARDAGADAGVPTHDRFQEPTPGYAEQCFYHHLGGERAHAALFNEELGLGAYVRYRTDTLPLLVEWKMMGEQEYVVGLEPSTARLEGRADVLARGEARMIAPGERLAFEVEIGVIEDPAELSEF